MREAHTSIPGARVKNFGVTQSEVKLNSILRLPKNSMDTGSITHRSKNDVESNLFELKSCRQTTTEDSKNDGGKYIDEYFNEITTQEF